MGHVEEVRQVLRRHSEFLPEALAARPQSLYEALGRVAFFAIRALRRRGEGYPELLCYEYHYGVVVVG